MDFYLAPHGDYTAGGWSYTNAQFNQFGSGFAAGNFAIDSLASDPAHVYLINWDPDSVGGAMWCWISQDSGATWTRIGKVHDGPNYAARASVLQVHAIDAATAYVCEKSVGIYRTLDGGLTWTSIITFPYGNLEPLDTGAGGGWMAVGPTKLFFAQLTRSDFDTSSGINEYTIFRAALDGSSITPMTSSPIVSLPARASGDYSAIETFVLRAIDDDTVLALSLNGTRPKLSAYTEADTVISATDWTPIGSPLLITPVDYASGWSTQFGQLPLEIWTYFEYAAASFGPGSIGSQNTIGGIYQKDNLQWTALPTDPGAGFVAVAEGDAMITNSIALRGEEPSATNGEETMQVYQNDSISLGPGATSTPHTYEILQWIYDLWPVPAEGWQYWYSCRETHTGTLLGDELFLQYQAGDGSWVDMFDVLDWHDANIHVDHLSPPQTTARIPRIGSLRVISRATVARALDSFSFWFWEADPAPGPRNIQFWARNLIAGESATFSGVNLYETLDVGILYRISSIGTITDLRPVNCKHPWDVLLLNGSTWLLAGDQADKGEVSVWRTTDAGATWTLELTIPGAQGFIWGPDGPSPPWAEGAARNKGRLMTPTDQTDTSQVAMLGRTSNLTYPDITPQLFWTSTDTGSTWTTLTLPSVAGNNPPYPGHLYLAEAPPPPVSIPSRQASIVG